MNSTNDAENVDKVFAWTPDQPMVRSNEMACPKCDHMLRDVKGKRCANRICGECGYEPQVYTTQGDIVTLSDSDQMEHFGGSQITVPLGIIIFIIAVIVYYFRNKNGTGKLWHVIILCCCSPAYLIYAAFDSLVGEKN